MLKINICTAGKIANNACTRLQELQTNYMYALFMLFDQVSNRNKFINS